jgi:hypothetical protein
MRLTRNRVLGAIGVVWGGAAVISGVFRAISGSSAYIGGWIVGLILGAVMCFAGVYYVIKG